MSKLFHSIFSRAGREESTSRLALEKKRREDNVGGGSGGGGGGGGGDGGDASHSSASASSMTYRIGVSSWEMTPDGEIVDLLAGPSSNPHPTPPTDMRCARTRHTLDTHSTPFQPPARTKD